MEAIFCNQLYNVSCNMCLLLIFLFCKTTDLNLLDLISRTEEVALCQKEILWSRILVIYNLLHWLPSFIMRIWCAHPGEIFCSYCPDERLQYCWNCPCMQLSEQYWWILTVFIPVVLPVNLLKMLQVYVSPPFSGICLFTLFVEHRCAVSDC